MNERAKEYRQQIADAFVKSLSEDPVNWKKEWQGLSLLPQNAISNKNYKGINRFWLSYVQQRNGWNDPRWCTFKQANDNGWHIKKGSKSAQIEYWSPYDTMKKKSCTWEEYYLVNQGIMENDRFIFNVKYFNVFNACQVEGMPELKKSRMNDIRPSALINKISASMGVPISNDGGDQAYYQPMSDQIHLPEPEVFESDYAYNATALHELAHSTGHAKRLNRNIVNLFGSPDHAYEELIAEISSCFMSAELPVSQTPDHIENHKAYIQSWIQEIQNKPEVLMKAIKEAEKTANYLEYHAGMIAKKDLDKEIRSTLEVSADKVLNQAQCSVSPIPARRPRRYGIDQEGQVQRTYDGKLPEQFTAQDVQAFLSETDRLMNAFKEPEVKESQPIKRTQSLKKIFQRNKVKSEEIER